MTYHAAVTWVRARRVGVLGFGVLSAVLLSAFTLAGAFFGFDFAGERTPYQVFQDSDFEPPAYKCLYKEQPCPFDPSEICCIPHPDAYFQFGTADTTASRPE